MKCIFILNIPKLVYLQSQYKKIQQQHKGKLKQWIGITVNGSGEIVHVHVVQRYL